MALLPLPLPTFLKAVEESSRPVCTPIALQGLEDLLPLNWGAMETTGEVSFLPRQHHCHWANCSSLPCVTLWLASPKKHRLCSGVSDAKGRGREWGKADMEGVRVLWRQQQQQQGLVWMSKAIAQQPTLWRREPKKQRTGGAGGYRPVTHTVGALSVRIS